MKYRARSQPLGFTPRDFPKWAEPEAFGLQRIEKSRREVDFAGRLPGQKQKLKTEIVGRVRLVGPIAASRRKQAAFSCGSAPNYWSVRRHNL
jgi:hypothetical protein